MTHVKGLLSLLLCLCLCLGLCACGGSEGTQPASQPPVSTEAPVSSDDTQAQTEAAPAPQRQTAVWGDWSVELPPDFALKGGDFLDENDPRYFSVRKSAFVFFDFKAEGEERILRNYEYNKNTYTNEQQDVEGSFGGVQWTGFQYSDGFGGYGFEAYATVDGEMIRVSAAGYPFADEMVKAVLGSLHRSPAKEAIPEDTEPPEPEEGAPVYEKIIHLKDVDLGIPAGYTEKKDATPAQYVMVNDETGGKVSVWNSSGEPGAMVASTMGSLEYEPREEDLNGLHWTIGVNEGFYCFGAATGDNVLLITIDFGGTEEEMENLIFSVLPKSEG